MTPEVRKEIERLRSQIHELQTQPVRGKLWTSWYKDACSLLSNHYGVDSPELQGFMEIRFEIHEPLRQAGDILQSAIETLPSFAEPLTISEDHYYQERLSEADEYLLALLLPPDLR